MASRALRPHNLNLSYSLETPEKDPEVSASKGKRYKPTKIPKIPVTRSHSPPPLENTLPKSTPFSPIRHSKPPRVAQNLLPRRLQQSKVIEPSTIVNLFLTETLMSEIAFNTNCYTTTKDAGLEGRGWRPVFLEEMKTWFGIIIYMGVCRMPAVEDYWKNNGLYPLHHIRDYMSLTRFEQIRRYFHVAHPEAPKETTSGRRLWHSKVDPLLNQLRAASRKYRRPPTKVSIDEAMVQCTGHSKDTYKMPSKPIDQGYKFHCYAAAGYVYDFIPTSNHSGPDPIPSSGFPEVDEMSATSRLVFHLMQRNCDEYGLDQSFDVFMDNFYTNLPLFSALRIRLGVGACGTARSNSKDFPTELSIPKNSKLPYHWRTSLVVNGVAVMLWMDSAPVLVMTTMHPTTGRSSEIFTDRKKPGPKSTNAAGVKTSNFWPAEGQWKANLPIPLCIYDYNFNMNGVDIADQLRSYYATHMISRRTWYPIFFWVLDTILINSYIIYGDHASAEKDLSHKEFRMRVGWDLILKGAVQKRKEPPTTQKQNQKKTRRISEHSTDAPRPFQHGEHLPVHVDERRDCVQCRWSSRLEKDSKKRVVGRTRYKCLTCDEPLCLSSDRNCFITFHSSVTM
jgi:hypothetical protein